MVRVQPPELKRFMDKRLSSVLRGFDQFMNIVLENAVNEKAEPQEELGMIVLRGNSIITIEALERIE